jgi:hypothetical protein
MEIHALKIGAFESIIGDLYDATRCAMNFNHDSLSPEIDLFRLLNGFPSASPE